jgi:hypothetical protein
MNGQKLSEWLRKRNKQPTIEDFDRERLGERQERKAQSDVRVNRHLVSVMSGATGFSHTNSARGAGTPGRATTNRGS